MIMNFTIMSSRKAEKDNRLSAPSYNIANGAERSVRIKAQSRREWYMDRWKSMYHRRRWLLCAHVELVVFKV